MKSRFKAGNRSHLSQQARGFTLTEILVVIAILLVVASLGYLGLSRARSAANSAVSVSNLRQWGIVLLQFQQEVNRFPPANITTGDDTTKPIRDSYGVSAYSGWDEFLAGGLNLVPSKVTQANEGLFRHPGDTAPKDPWNRARRTYAMVTGNQMIGRTNTLSLGLASVPDPSRTLLLTERPRKTGTFVAFSASGADINSPQYQIDGNPKLNGNGKFNYLFADGHVESIHPRDTIGSGSFTNPKGKWTVAQDD